MRENLLAAIEAIQAPIKVFRCWNCDTEGHGWDMCLQKRRVFCYGRGTKNICKLYKQCMCVSCSEIGKLEERPIQQQWSNGPEITTVNSYPHLPASSEISLQATNIPEMTIQQSKKDNDVDSPRLYPIRTYHERLKEYWKAKD